MPSLTEAEKSAYPFSTRDGSAIPLEVIDPIACLFIAIPAGGYKDFAIAESVDLCYIHSPEGCVIVFNNPVGSGFTITDNIWIPWMLYVPKDTIITVRMYPGSATVKSADANASTVVVQQIRKWNALALKQQVNIKN